MNKRRHYVTALPGLIRHVVSRVGAASIHHGTHRVRRTAQDSIGRWYDIVFGSTCVCGWVYYYLPLLLCAEGGAATAAARPSLFVQLQASTLMKHAPPGPTTIESLLSPTMSKHGTCPRVKQDSTSKV